MRRSLLLAATLAVPVVLAGLLPPVIAVPWQAAPGEIGSIGVLALPISGVIAHWLMPGRGSGKDKPMATSGS